MDVNLDVTLHNVVCCFHTKCHIKLKDFCLKAKNVEYIREHGMVRLRLRKPATTSSIWASGKISVTGAKSEKDAKLAARRVGRILQKAGYDIGLHNYRVVNILAKCTLPFQVRLDSFANANRSEAQYEPELHPAVVVNMKNFKTVLHVFSTGSVTVTTSSIDNLSSALSILYPLVVQHKIASLSTVPTSTSYSTQFSHIPAVKNEQNNGKANNGFSRTQAMSMLRVPRSHPTDRGYVTSVVDDIEEEEGLNGDELNKHRNFPNIGSAISSALGVAGHCTNGGRCGVKRKKEPGSVDDLSSGSESECS